MKRENSADFWLPGQKLDYPGYGEQQLLEDWVNIYAPDDSRPAIAVQDGILGVVHLPDQVPNRIASVDLCEVVRQTHAASALAFGKEKSHIGRRVWNYTTLDLDGNSTGELVKAVMNADLVQPVEEIDDIRKILQEWKADGIYTIANTSTLPNCERATIENLLARELPDCFDGIVLPRNYLGDGPTTKGDALRAVAYSVADIRSQKLERVLHIDDAPHHLRDVDAVVDEIAYMGAVIMPVYQAGEHAEEDLDIESAHDTVLLADSPLDAFRIASDFLFS